MIRYAALIVLLNLTVYSSIAQLSGEDASLLQARQQGIYDHYDDLGVAPLLSGKEYHPDYRNTVNSPHFNGDEPHSGTLLYDDVYYREIELQYNLHTQQLVVQRETRNDEQLIIIDTDKAATFTMGNHGGIPIAIGGGVKVLDHRIQHPSEHRSKCLFTKKMSLE